MQFRAILDGVAAIRRFQMKPVGFSGEAGFTRQLD
jgi:hypothetical protein